MVGSAVLEMKNNRNIQSKKSSRNRDRDYLTDSEVESLISAAGSSRHGVRDQLLITLAWRHGLRCEELTGMELSQLHLDSREIYIKRVKNSLDTHHPLSEDEVRLIKRYLRIRQDNKGAGSSALFLTERGEGMLPHAFNYILMVVAKRAGFTFAVYPHILRHSCGYHLANKGISAFVIAGFLGHKQIQNSLRYTHVSAAQFKGVW